MRMAQHERDPHMQQCIQHCTQCHNVCTETVAYCIERSGKQIRAFHLRLLLDCADICATSAAFMLRGSDMHRLTCAVCAQICAHCADECERMADDQQMSACGEICRRCAESCSAMAAA